MSAKTQRWQQAIQTLLDDKLFQNEVAQIRAKAQIVEISREIPKYNWAYVAQRIIRNLTGASLGLEALSIDKTRASDQFQSSALRIARTWESLAKLGEWVDRKIALSNASVAYELAGYQANAACLARQLYPDFSSLQNVSLDAITSAFLQRLFLRVRRFSTDLTREPEGELDERHIAEASALALAADGLSQASEYFLSGKKAALLAASKSLQEAETILILLGAISESNMLHSTRSLLPIMEEKSTWQVLGSIDPSPRWNRYLKLLARGVGKNILNSRSVSEIWPSQLKAIQSDLLGKSSKIIKMPTSAGKTRVAELAMVSTLIAQPNAKCVYIAPYRALVAELEQSLFNLFGDLGFRVSSILGSYESDEFEQQLISDADILVATPEKLDLVLRIEPRFLDNVRLFVMDEGQIVHDERRGVKFELLLTRIRRRLPKARVIFLSAVVPEESLRDFAKLFGADASSGIVVSDWRPSILRWARFEWNGPENGVIRYSLDEEMQKTKEISEFVPGIIKQNSYEYLNIETGRMNRRRFPDVAHKAQTAAELAFKFAELGPVLVFCSQINFVEAVGNALLERIGLQRLSGLPIPQYFTRSFETRSNMAAKEWLGDDHLVTKLLSHNTSLHHGDLPETVKEAIEQDFRERRIRVVIATNTLAQGVNLPIRTIIVHSSSRYSDEGLKRMSARDYWNMAGRAGRAGEETEGTVIHITMSNQDRADYQYYNMRREKLEPVQSALFQMLKDLADTRLSEEAKRLNEEAASQKLDPEILALLCEEGKEMFSESTIDNLLEESLVKSQADRSGIKMTTLTQSILATADRIRLAVPSESRPEGIQFNGIEYEQL